MTTTSPATALPTTAPEEYTPEQTRAAADWLHAALALRDADQELDDARAAVEACEANVQQRNAEAQQAYAVFQASYQR